MSISTGNISLIYFHLISISWLVLHFESIETRVGLIHGIFQQSGQAGIQKDMIWIAWDPILKVIGNLKLYGLDSRLGFIQAFHTSTPLPPPPLSSSLTNTSVCLILVWQLSAFTLQTYST